MNDKTSRSMMYRVTTFAGRLNKIMNELGVSFWELQQWSDINSTSLRKYIEGRVIPTKYIAFRIAEALDIDRTTFDDLYE